MGFAMALLPVLRPYVPIPKPKPPPKPSLDIPLRAERMDARSSWSALALPLRNGEPDECPFEPKRPCTEGVFDTRRSSSVPCPCPYNPGPRLWAGDPGTVKADEDDIDDDDIVPDPPELEGVTDGMTRCQPYSILLTPPANG